MHILKTKNNMNNLTAQQIERAKKIYQHTDQRSWQAIGGGEIVAELYYYDKEGDEVFIGELWGSNGTREPVFTQEIEDKSGNWIDGTFEQMEKDGVFIPREKITETRPSTKSTR